MTTWSLMIISNGMLTTCPILRAPEIQAPRPVIGLPLDGHVVERPNAMSITCSISASSSAMVALSKLSSTPMTWPTCYITTMWPRAKVSRSASGRWKVKSSAKGGGPSKTYRTKALASIACDKRGIGASRAGPLSMMSVDFDGGADMIESGEFGSVMVARPTRVCIIKMCKR